MAEQRAEASHSDLYSVQSLLLSHELLFKAQLLPIEKMQTILVLFLSQNCSGEEIRQCQQVNR